VSTSGGTGVWLADVCSAAGLDFPAPDDALNARLAQVIPAIGGIANPVDMSASVIEGGGEVLAKALRILTEADFADAVIIAMSLAARDRIKQMQAALEPFLRCTRLPVIIHSQAFASQDNLEALAQIGGIAFGMRDTAYALRTLSDYGAFRRRWQAREAGEAGEAGEAQAAGASAAPEVSAEACVQMLDAGRVADLLRAYGIPLPTEAGAQDREQALRVARAIGYPVALKITSADVPHRSDVGALALDVRDDAALHAAYDRVMANVARAVPHARIDGMQVQKMMPAATEMVVGITRDADFGPLLMVGLGGVFVELLRDVAFSPVPVSVGEAEALIRSLKGFPLLEGRRGTRPGNLHGLATLASNLSRLAADHAGVIEEIDLNPVLVYEDSVCAVDHLLIRSGASSHSSAKGS
jgi:acetate---CoA ligase (ADP-forming)